MSNCIKNQNGSFCSTTDARRAIRKYKRFGGVLLPVQGYLFDLEKIYEFLKNIEDINNELNPSGAKDTDSNQCAPCIRYVRVYQSRRISPPFKNKKDIVFVPVLCDGRDYLPGDDKNKSGKNMQLKAVIDDKFILTGSTPCPNLCS